LLASEPNVRERDYGDSIHRYITEEDDEEDEDNQDFNEASQYKGASPSSLPESSDRQDEEDSEIFEVSNRVKVDGVRLGTVRHVGPTRFASGVWIGVELDEKMGKNTGVVDGIQYFSCRPFHGLFVRPERLALVSQSSSPLLEQQHGEQDLNGNTDDNEEEQDHDEPQRGSHPQNRTTLAPGSLSHVDPRDLISAFRERRNPSGSLSRDDFVSAFKTIEPKVGTLDALELFDAFDADESGFLHAKEFIPGAIVLCGGDRDEKIQMSFQLLDFDGSGYLEREEVEGYMLAVFRLVKHAYPEVFSHNGVDPQTLAQESVDSAFEFADQNSDGKISFVEFRQWMLTMTGNVPSTRSSGKEAATNSNGSRHKTASQPSLSSATRQVPPTTPIQPLPEMPKQPLKSASDWKQVEKWLTEDAGVVIPYELKASLEQFQEHGISSLVRVARLTPADVNRLNLSFDLRLRLITHVRALAKSLVFEASERRLHLSPLAKS
jgi:Ca2+-binding EF-hand superfamily protein